MSLRRTNAVILKHPDNRRCSWCQEPLYQVLRYQVPAILCAYCDVPEGFE